MSDDRTGTMTNPISLNSGTELVGDYRIERVLGAGGFGITYLADELSLDRRVTIKEYFPSDFAARSDGIDAVPRSQDCSSDYNWGLDRFIEEAQTLARFDHPNIVRVYRYFRANNTGYMVLHFEEGQSLKSWLKGLKRAPRQKELDAIVPKLLDALELIHKADFLHRDIAPDNIIIRSNGQPVLIDFGSARGEIASHSKTVSALVKPGYSPYEQYAETSSQQGPWTDIYALAATLYHAVTGKRPPDAPTRMVKDEIVPACEAAVGAYRKGFLKAIDTALQLKIQSRPQTIVNWRGDLLAPDPARPGWRSRVQQTNQAGAEKVSKQAPRKAQASEPVKGPKPGTPPQPDAPGPRGGLLDFLDGLQQRRTSKTPPPAVQKQKPSLEPKSVKKPQAPKRERIAKPAPKTRGLSAILNRLRTSPNPIKVKKKPPKKAQSARPVPTPKPPRPRRVRARKRHRLGPVFFKLFAGVGMATIAVAMHDRLPRFSTPTAPITTSSIRQKTAPGPQRLAQELRGHHGGTGAIVYTDDGQSVVSAGKDGTVKVWDAKTGTLTRTLSLSDGAATSLDVSGTHALTGHQNGTIALWDLSTGQKKASFKRNDAEIWSVTFAGGSNRFAAASHDWTIALWDTSATSQPLHVFEGHKSAAQSLAFSASGRGSVLASGSADKTVKLWNPKTFKLRRTYRGHRDFITNMAFSPDARYLATASLDGNIRIWSTSSRRLYRSYKAHNGAIGGIAFAPSGRTLASAGEDGKIRLWNIRRRRNSRTLSEKAGKVQSLDFSPTGDQLATGSADGRIRLWSTPASARVSRK